MFFIYLADTWPWSEIRSPVLHATTMNHQETFVSHLRVETENYFELGKYLCVSVSDTHMFHVNHVPVVFCQELEVWKIKIQQGVNKILTQFWINYNTEHCEIHSKLWMADVFFLGCDIPKLANGKEFNYFLQKTYKELKSRLNFIWNSLSSMFSCATQQEDNFAQSKKSYGSNKKVLIFCQSSIQQAAYNTPANIQFIVNT